MTTLKNITLLGFLCLAATGCSKDAEVRTCNPGTVLLHFSCDKALGNVTGTADLEGLAGQKQSTNLSLACPGTYNVEINVSDYQRDGVIKAIVNAKAGDAVLAKDRLVSVTLGEGCTKFDVNLDPTSENPDAPVKADEGDGGPADDRDGSALMGPDADPTASGLSRGESCVRDDQCNEGHCADGVCCDKACDGVCMACTLERTGSATGQCAPTKSGVKHSKCDTKDAKSCGTNGMCNGAGQCSFWDSTNECVAATCNAGDYVPAQKCNGMGTCQAASPSKCGEYACTTQGCKTSCGGNTDCSAGVQCINGKCGGKRALGEACGANSECTSPGFCIDGVCCGSKCDGTCEACNATITGGNNGECTPVPASKGPQAECAVQSASSCGTTGRCDGARKCEFHTAGTDCAAQMCSGAGYTPARKCDGNGTCLSSAVTTCGSYICSGGACKNPCANDNDCVAGNFCTGGVCTAKRANGGSCVGGANQCTSGICESGICCNVSCTGPCSSCSSGTCTNLCTTRELPLVASASGHMIRNINFAATAAAVNVVGDVEGQFGNGADSQIYLSFNMSAIPAGHVAQTATLTWGPATSADGCTSDVFAKLGSLQIEPMLYGPTLEWADDQLQAVGPAETFATKVSDLETPKDVLLWFYGDLASRNQQSNLTQYRIKFSTLSNNDGVEQKCSLTKANFKLTVQTRAP